jgi:hypothetical protein
MTAGKPTRRRERPESEFQTRVLQYAAHHGWRHFHAPDNRPVPRMRGGRVVYVKQTVTKGWPDVTLWHVRTGQMLFAELKAEKGRVDPEQTRLLAELEACGQEVHLWRPSDWDRIAARLGHKTVPAESPDQRLPGQEPLEL